MEKNNPWKRGPNGRLTRTGETEIDNRGWVRGSDGRLTRRPSQLEIMSREHSPSSQSDSTPEGSIGPSEHSPSSQSDPTSEGSIASSAIASMREAVKDGRLGKGSDSQRSSSRDQEEGGTSQDSSSDYSEDSALQGPSTLTRENLAALEKKYSRNIKKWRDELPKPVTEPTESATAGSPSHYWSEYEKETITQATTTYDSNLSSHSSEDPASSFFSGTSWDSAPAASEEAMATAGGSEDPASSFFSGTSWADSSAETVPSRRNRSLSESEGGSDQSEDARGSTSGSSAVDASLPEGSKDSRGQGLKRSRSSDLPKSGDEAKRSKKDLSDE